MGSTAIIYIILFIIIYSVYKKTDCFSAFTEGMRNGISSVYSIFPSVFALFISIGALRSSGLIDLLCSLFDPLTDFTGFPSRLVPFVLLRPVSGSGSLSFASDIFLSHGPDSFEGRLISVMMGSTETTFYTTAVYFGACGTRDIRHTLKCALLADFFSVAVSFAVCKIYY